MDRWWHVTCHRIQRNRWGRSMFSSLSSDMLLMMMNLNEKRSLRQWGQNHCTLRESSVNNSMRHLKLYKSFHFWFHSRDVNEMTLHYTYMSHYSIALNSSINSAPLYGEVLKCAARVLLVMDYSLLSPVDQLWYAVSSIITVMHYYEEEKENLSCYIKILRKCYAFKVFQNIAFLLFIFVRTLWCLSFNRL